MLLEQKYLALWDNCGNVSKYLARSTMGVGNSNVSPNVTLTFISKVIGVSIWNLNIRMDHIQTLSCSLLHACVTNVVSYILFTANFGVKYPGHFLGNYCIGCCSNQ